MICNKKTGDCKIKGNNRNLVLALFLGFALMTLFTMKEDPWQQAINEVAEFGGWDAEDIVFNAGSQTVLMNYARLGVKVQVNHADGSSTQVNAVVIRFPFFGYTISCYAVGDNNQCVEGLAG